jgi:hypothetical protein
LSRPALALFVGAAEPSTVTLGMAVAIVRAAERHCDNAAAELVLLADDGPERDEARLRFDAACDRLDAALNRRDRVISELGAEPWLWAVPPLEVARG